jgi:hypothetical protein
MKYLSLLALLFLVSACSQKGAYESIQIGGKHDCQKLYGDEYDKCVEPYTKPYDEYQRDREEALK